MPDYSKVIVTYDEHYSAFVPAAGARFVASTSLEVGTLRMKNRAGTLRMKNRAPNGRTDRARCH